MYHPNIDLQGKVCLNILREDWKPTLSMSAVVLGLQFLFSEPNPGDPLNKGAIASPYQQADRVRTCCAGARPDAQGLLALLRCRADNERRRAEVQA